MRRSVSSVCELEVENASCAVCAHDVDRHDALGCKICTCSRAGFALQAMFAAPYPWLEPGCSIRDIPEP